MRALLGLVLLAAHSGVIAWSATEFINGAYPKATWLTLLSISVTLGAINLKLGKRS